MAKFDFYHSTIRRFYESKRNFSGMLFGVATIINIILAGLAIFLFFSLDGRGLGQIILALVLFFESYLLAKHSYQPAVSQSDNLADKFSLEMVELFDRAAGAAQKEGVVEITPEYLFSQLPLVSEGRIIYLRLGLPYNDEPKNTPTKNIPRFSEALVCLLGNVFSQMSPIEIEDFILALAKSSTEIQAYLKQFNLVLDDLEKVTFWLKRLKPMSHRPKLWEDSAVGAGVGQDWSFGYTPVLSSYSYDLSRYFEDSNLQIDIFSHTSKLADIQTILARSDKNNCLLVGEPGVGKKTIVNALALKLARGDCLPPLKYKRIRQLDIGQLLAGTGVGELEERLQGALSDAVRAGNIILYIDNFQSLLGGYSDTAQKAGSIDASGMLLPFLQKSNLRIIASVTPDDYFQRVRSNAAVAQSFEKLDIAPASIDDTLAIILESLSFIENKYNVFFPFQTLKKTVGLADRFIHGVPFPEKALRLVEETAVRFSSNQPKLITPEEVETLISEKTNVPMGQVQEHEKEKLLNLESFLHRRVVGQVEAIKAVSDTLRRARVGIASGKRPIGVFLFLGPTGVGKTETAKALAESYFGSDDKMIRLDMSEYQEVNSIGRLIGTTENPNGTLTNAILQDPFSLILLDELEKANKDILNVFLQVFEDGRLTDPRGRVSDFTNAIIIATSNAGSEFIRENVTKLDNTGLKTALIEKLQQEGMFTPEFLNRFDGVIVFHPLLPQEIKQVAQLMIGDINKRLDEKKISVQVAPEALEKLVQLGYDPQFGARPMRRVIQEKIENLLAKKMLEGAVQEGQMLNIGLEDIE